MSNGETFDTKSQLLNILFKPLVKPFESSLQSISLQEVALSFRVLCIDVSVTVTSCATECLCNQSEIPGAFHIPLA